MRSTFITLFLWHFLFAVNRTRTLCSSLIKEFGDKNVIAYFSPQYPEYGNVNVRPAWSLENVQKTLRGVYGYPVIRPFDSYLYDSRNWFVRRRAARLARSNGITGFAYLHRWRKGLVESNIFFNELLKDEEPNISFVLVWMLTPENDASHAPNATAYQVDSRLQHFEWMRRMFEHKNYIAVGGRAMILLHNLNEMVHSATIVEFLRMEAAKHNRELHIVQLNGRTNNKILPSNLPFVDAVSDYPPHFASKVSSFNGDLHPYYHSVSSSFNNEPMRRKIAGARKSLSASATG